MNDKNKFSRFMNLLPAMVLALSILLFPMPVCAADADASAPCNVSILGDSISNYVDTAPSGYNFAYPMGDVDNVSKTWWMRTLNDLGYTLCMDDAASGSRVTPSGADETGKLNFTTDQRLSDLRKPDGTTPDVILIMGGTNDLIESVPLDQFRSSYDALLKKLLSADWYPGAKIVCLTILPNYDRDWDQDGKYVLRTNQNGNTAEDFNTVIREVAATNNIPVIDTYNCGIDLTNCETMTNDGTHPTDAGMQAIASVVENALPGILGGTETASAEAAADSGSSSAAFFSADALLGTIDRVAGIANRKARQTEVNPTAVSILGDSISTFEETLPDGYKNQYPYGDLTQVSQTWWSLTLTGLGYTRCTNDSAAGSRVCGDVLENGDMPCFISNRRIMDLTAGDTAPVPGEVPGIILIFGGTNDQAQNMSQEDFEKSYNILLHKLKAYYPGSQIVCMSLIDHSDVDSSGVFLKTPWLNKAGESVSDFSSIIQRAAADNLVKFIDIHACGIDNSNAEQYTVDGLHPNAAGAALIAQYIVANLPSVLNAN